MHARASGAVTSANIPTFSRNQPIGEPDDVTQTWARTQVSRLALGVAVLALVLIAVTGFERRLAVEAACAGWGDCSGWHYLSQVSGKVGALHLGVTSQLGLLTIGLLGLAWTRLRDDVRVLRAAMSAALLMIVQLGMLFVPASGQAATVAASVHVGATALLLAVAIYVVLLPFRQRVRDAVVRDWTAIEPVRTTTTVATGLIFLVLVSGAYVSAAHPGVSCTDWPLCGVSVEGAMDGSATAQAAHQSFVGIAGIVFVALVVIASRLRHAMHASPILPALIALFVIEIAIGGAGTILENSAVISAAHYSVAGASWAVLLVLLIAVQPATHAIGVTSHARSTMLRDYVRVMKPGIMLLLLTTTLGAMLVAGSGWPSLSLVLATLLGGALASGGASALNCYLDRDIDVIMARTRKRPIPTGGLTATQVRNFGLVLSLLAIVELTLLVNPVAAGLALAGNLFYVVVYTRFLKRSTPQNIVIGGAAGAFPPLVGWAAVTGSVSLTSILLFAIIYYWTPPHFWSLALLKARDYGRAGIPMLPVTHGDQQTRKFILLYSFQLIAVTILLPATGTVGLIYLAAAIILGAIFVSYAARMYREGTSRLAWRLFKYSNYYLALLLLAMVIDRAITR